MDVEEVEGIGVVLQGAECAPLIWVGLHEEQDDKLEMENETQQ